jgi:hypothetical protein
MCDDNVHTRESPFRSPLERWTLENPPDRELRSKDEEARLATQDASKDPNSFTEAMRQEEANEWKIAMKDEMESLQKNNTWTLVDLPPGRKAITGRWVLKTKLNGDGSIAR